MPWGEMAVLTPPCVLAEVSSFFAIWISFSCLFNHVITEERRKGQAHFLPLTSCLKQQVALPQKWQLSGLVFLLKLKHHYKAQSQVSSTPTCHSVSSSRVGPPHAHHPKHHLQRKSSLHAPLGCCIPTTDRSLFSINDNNHSSLQKKKKKTPHR